MAVLVVAVLAEAITIRNHRQSAIRKTIDNPPIVTLQS
jgi:hypothetical protein